MKMSRMTSMGLAWLVAVGLGCVPKDAKETDWCDYDCSRSDKRNDKRKAKRVVGPGTGGVLHEELPMSWAKVPSDDNTVRPEVLLVTVKEKRAADGALLVRVKSLDDGQVAVIDPHCTGTFISEHELLTAAHCLRCTDWARTYVVMGFHAKHPWPVEGKWMAVPANRVLQLCHVKGCMDEQSSGLDVALVHTCSSDEKMPGFERRTVPEGEPSLDGLAIYSHAGGLPLQEHRVRYSPGSSVAYFTNDAGGSGAAMINGKGEIIGIVGGDVPPSATINCTSNPKNKHCKGQPLTLHSQLREVMKSESVCSGLVRFSNEYQDGCRECNGTLGGASPGK